MISSLIIIVAAFIQSISATSLRTNLRINATSHFANSFRATGVISDWTTCDPSSDTCANSGSVCCVATADQSTGKLTCRPGASDCSGPAIADYNTCSQMSGYCTSSNYVCCVAPDDTSTQKTTCRPSNNCAVPNTVPSPAATPVISTFATEMLSEHNNARAAVGTQPLNWSTKLANDAQAWANNCVFADSAQDGGSNAAAYTSSPYSSQNTLTLFNEWMGEKAEFDSLNSLVFDPTCGGKGIDACGHYTQVIWGTTTQVGCGIVQPCTVNSPFDSNFQSWSLLICFYSPAGNVVGENVY